MGIRNTESRSAQTVSIMDSRESKGSCSKNTHPKQRCSLSQLLLSIYSEQALENCFSECSKVGIQINEATLHSLLFSEDQILYADHDENLTYTLEELKDELEQSG